MIRTRIAVVAVTSLVGVGLLPSVASAAIPDTTFVSIGAAGAMPNGRADRPQISGDGRYVTFDSAATNLDPRDTSSDIDVYRRDLRTGKTELVSVGRTPCPEGTGQLAICNTYSWPSDDGNFVAFTSDKGITTATPPGRRVYVRDMNAGTTEMVSVNSDGKPANGASGRPMISSTGRFVAFTSKATNLSPLGGNGTDLVYLRDRQLGTTTLVSTNYNGGLPTGTTADGESTESYRGIVSSDGNIVAYASQAGDIVRGDTNNREDIFVKNMQTGVTQRVSVRADGREAAGGGARPYLSPDGRYVLYNTYDPIVPEDTNGKSDVYMVDISVTPYKVTWVSEGKTGTVNPGNSLRGFVSADGRYAVFNSYANNLVERDFNGGRGDAFVRDLVAGKTYLLSLSTTGGGANGPSFRPVISDDGRVVTFLSQARNLVSGDTSSGYQTYAVSTASVMTASDTVKPTVGIGSPTRGATVSNPITFSGSVGDDTGIRSVDVAVRRGNSTTGFEWLQTDGTSWGAANTAHREAATVDAATGTWSATFRFSVPDGSYSSQVRAFDTSGNMTAAWVGYKVATASTSTDTTAPTVTVASPASRSTVTGAVTFSGSAGDDVGVKAVEFYVKNTGTGQYLQDDGSWAGTFNRVEATLSAPGAKSTDWSRQVSLPAGTYASQVNAWDTSNNQPEKKPWLSFTVS